MMREAESGRPHPHHQHPVAACRPRQRLPQVERVPPREEAVDLEAPGQCQHVAQRARLDLRNVDRILLLVDAGLHAVVADPVPGGGDHRIVDADHRERAERVPRRLERLELGDLLVQRAAGERHAEDALLERDLLRRVGRGFFARIRASRSPCPACGTRCSSWPGPARRPAWCRDRSAAKPSRRRRCAGSMRKAAAPCSEKRSACATRR